MSYYFGNADSLSHALPVKAYWKWDPRSNKMIYNPGYVAKKRDPAKFQGVAAGGSAGRFLDRGTPSWQPTATASRALQDAPGAHKRRTTTNAGVNYYSEIMANRRAKEQQAARNQSARERYGTKQAAKAAARANYEKSNQSVLGKAGTAVKNLYSNDNEQQRMYDAYARGYEGDVAKAESAYNRSPETIITRLTRSVQKWAKTTLEKVKNSRFGQAAIGAINKIKDKGAAIVKRVKDSKAFAIGKGIIDKITGFVQSRIIDPINRRRAQREEYDENRAIAERAQANYEKKQAKQKAVEDARRKLRGEYTPEEKRQQLQVKAKQAELDKRIDDAQWELDRFAEKAGDAEYQEKRRKQREESRRYEW